MEIVENLGNLAGLAKPGDIDRLGVDLCLVAERFVTVQDEISIEWTNSKRKSWILENIVGPTDQLLITLENSNSRIWAQYPITGEIDWLDQTDRAVSDTNQSGLKKIEGKLGFSRSKRSQRSQTNREKTVDALKDLRAWASKTIAKIEEPRKGELKQSTQLKFDLVFEFCCVYREHSNDNSLIAKSYDDRPPTPFVDFVRSAAEPVLGRRDLLIEQLKSAKSMLNNVEYFDASTGAIFSK